MTVSRVVNGSTRVRPTTRKRVERAMRDLAYIPNRAARSLVVNKLGVLALVIPDISNPFFPLLARGAEAAARAAGYTVILGNSDEEFEKEDAYLRAVCALRVDGVLLAPSGHRSRESLDLLARQRIPVVGFDSGVDSNIPVTTAATDNIAAAGAAADKMAEMIGDEGEVGVIVHDQTSRTGIDRRDGFVSRMKDKHPKVNIVDIQYGGGDQLKSTDLAKAMMQAHPNLKGFFGANEGSIIGVLNAVKELNKAGKLVVIGYDSGKQQTDAIRSGVEAGAITQDPIGIGYKCVDSAVKAIKGEQLPKNIDTGFYWYDKTNIDDPKIKAVLYD